MAASTVRRMVRERCLWRQLGALWSERVEASLFDATVDAQDRALVYKFNLKPGKTLSPGSSQFAVRFTYGLPHNPADDTYYRERLYG